jgi:hypothetical protein
VVPGNHDIPLYNVFRRFLTPLRKYTRYMTDDLAPEYVDEEIAVLGINTARSLTFKDGRINHDQVAQMRQRMGAVDPHLTRIIVTHHPFDLPDSFDQDDLVDRAPMAMQAFAECGVDLLLAGHLHASHAGNTQAALQDQRLRGAGGAGRHGHLHARQGRVEFLQRHPRRARHGAGGALQLDRRDGQFRAGAHRALPPRRRRLVPHRRIVIRNPGFL